VDQSAIRPPKISAHPEPDGQFVMIPLTQGKYALVDEGDADWIVYFGKWHAARHGRTWYARRRDQGSKRLVSMHALIAGDHADHANRNGLDNRRVNLREATSSQNNANKGPASNNTSGYKGITWNRGARRWKAQIGIDGQRRYLGMFDDPAEAARTYNRAALEIFGEFAWLNPIPDAAEPPAA